MDKWLAEKDPLHQKKFPLGADLRCHLSIGDATVSWNFWNVGEARNADVGLAKVVSMCVLPVNLILINN
jgi:hypothetical protein